MSKYLQQFILTLSLIVPTVLLHAQTTPDKTTMEIYGQVMLDMGYDFGRVAPDWYDMLRPTQILDDDGNRYLPKGNFFMGVRQTNVGMKHYLETGAGKLTTQFEFELVGTGNDAGQTTFRLRHAYAELGKFGAGQTNSVFMDGDIFPNTIEYWGPCGMVFFRNIQVRYMPVKKEDKQLSFSLEMPGAVADQGQYGKDFVYQQLLDSVRFRFPMPDIAAAYKTRGDWGHVQLAGILRLIKWKDVSNNPLYNFSSGTLAWGFNLSSNIQLSKKITFKGSVTGGAGVQNYMDDAHADIGIDRQYENQRKPIDGEAIPMLGLMAFFDLNWNDKWSSSIGYSRLGNKTKDSQLATAFKTGQYAVANLLFYPAKNCMLGAELQWAKRQNNHFSGDPVFNLPAENGKNASNVKMQMSFRYLFHQAIKKKN